jgi:hypothetical protein
MTLDIEKCKIRSWPLHLGFEKVKRHFGGKMSFLDL